MNLYSKMKNLENKYIDLANFYKQELVKTHRKNSEEEVTSKHSMSPGRAFDKSPELE